MYIIRGATRNAERCGAHIHTLTLKAMIINIKWWFGRKNHSKKNWYCFDDVRDVRLQILSHLYNNNAKSQQMKEKATTTTTTNKKKLASIYYRWRSINVWLAVVAAPPMSTVYTVHIYTLCVWTSAKHELNMFIGVHAKSRNINVCRFHVFLVISNRSTFFLPSSSSSVVSSLSEIAIELPANGSASVSQMRVIFFSFGLSDKYINIGIYLNKCVCDESMRAMYVFNKW